MKEGIRSAMGKWVQCLALSLFTPLALAGSKVTYLHNDHLGRTVMATDASANVVWQVEYRPFGEVEIITGDPVQAKLFGFPGQHWDEETGLYYNHYRYYDSSTGRYPTADPRGILLDFSDPQRQIAAQMGIPIPRYDYVNGLNHLYSYAGHNPVIFTDPTGEIAPLAVVGIAAAVGGVAGGAISAANGGSFTSGFLSTGGGILAGGLVAIASAGNFGLAVTAQLSAEAAILSYTAASTYASASSKPDCE